VTEAQTAEPPRHALSGPLDGVRVLDLSTVVMGPFATQTLGDLGADIITIETAIGDTNRFMGPGSHAELSGVAMNLMRNKRSVVLDLKQEAGRAAFLRIAATSDVVVTNLRPGALARLCLAYDDVAMVRPDIVFCQAAGFPSDSERADDPAYDDIIQSACGVGDLFARLGSEPMLLPTLVADKVCGLTVAGAVTAALFHRQRTGEGQRVEVPMIDVMRAFVLVEHGAGAVPVPPVADVGYERILTTERRPRRTLDGWISVLPYRRRDYRAVFASGGRDDLHDDPRLAGRAQRIKHSASLYRDVAEVLATRTNAFWLDFCRRQGIPATEVATLDDLVDALPIAHHPIVGDYHTVPPPVRFAASPASVRRPAPLIGEHGREVLLEVGYSPDELDALERDGIVGAR
jgi:crotonobetainyl-CoA:carnitine CoA-transferase CaiB-like acyl-CoA transferase